MDIVIFVNWMLLFLILSIFNNSALDFPLLYYWHVIYWFFINKLIYIYWMITSGIVTDILGTKQMFLIFLEPGCEDKSYSHEKHRGRSSTACIDYRYNGNSEKKGTWRLQELEKSHRMEGVGLILECWVQITPALSAMVAPSPTCGYWALKIWLIWNKPCRKHIRHVGFRKLSDKNVKCLLNILCWLDIEISTMWLHYMKWNILRLVLPFSTFIYGFWNILNGL